MKTTTTTINGFKRNSMGTTSFNLKMPNMRKEQDFCVYPISAGDDANNIKIQSDTRIGRLDLVTGKGIMSQSHPNGAFAHNLMLDKMVDFNLSAEDLTNLKNAIALTASKKAGTNGVIYCDNSNAGLVSLL